MQNLLRKRHEPVGALIRTIGLVGRRAGAAFVKCPDDTVHRALDTAREVSAMRLFHIADGVVLEGKRRDFQRIGAIGTPLDRSCCGNHG